MRVDWSNQRCVRNKRAIVAVLTNLLSLWTYGVSSPQGGPECDPSKLVALTDRTSAVARADDPDQVRKCSYSPSRTIFIADHLIAECFMP